MLLCSWQQKSLGDRPLGESTGDLQKKVSAEPASSVPDPIPDDEDYIGY